MQLKRRLIVYSSLLAALLFSGASIKSLHAYPQFQLSTDNARCSLCHVSPSGGGLLNSYGRSESADSIAYRSKGNGDWLYGLYKEPTWLKMGADVRFATLSRTQAGDTEQSSFLMQSDLYAQFKFGKQWSFYINVGPRAQARQLQVKPTLSRMSSREHYLMFKPKSKGMVYRLGRFMMPFGIRSPDHSLFIRRDLGLYAWQETYNVSAAKIENHWEAHATLFLPVPFFLQRGETTVDKGLALYFEKRITEEKKTAFGLQARIGQSSDRRQSVLGGVFKHHSQKARLLFLIENNLVLEEFKHGGPSRAQMVSYFGGSFFPIQGLMMTTAYQFSDSNLSLDESARHGFSFDLQVFPWAKWEINLQAKVELNGDSSRRTQLGFLQLHYFL